MKRGYSHLRCGLIGKKLGHSFSKPIHNALADYDFAMLELAPEELEGFAKHGELDAFCITIPYKKDIMPFLDEISPEAEAIGAVNVVVRKNGKLLGYNTDYFGLNYTFVSSGINFEGKKALVFGRGGASATVCTLLKDKGVRELVVFGSADNTPQNVEKHADAEIVVNATPVGMFPNNCASPVSLALLPKCEAVFDLIYNPARTALMIEAEQRGIFCVNGLSMLVAQAARAFEHFTGDDYEDGIIEQIISDLKADTENLVLIGMPGCGKSTVGREVAAMLSREFIDADDEFLRMHGITPATAIETLGEEKFRDMETEVLFELGKLSAKVIATGGGAPTKELNYPLLHQNSVIFFLQRDLDKLALDGRPLSKKGSLEELYKKRINAYTSFADVTVHSTEIKEKTAELIVAEFKNHFKDQREKT